MPGTIGRGVTPQGVSWAMEEINQPLVGWNKFPLRPIRFEKKKTRWKEFPSGKEESYSKYDWSRSPPLSLAQGKGRLPYGTTLSLLSSYIYYMF